MEKKRNLETYVNHKLGLNDQLHHMMVLISSEAGGNQKLAERALTALNNDHQAEDQRVLTGGENEI
jgi:hypothetical protein